MSPQPSGTDCRRALHLCPGPRSRLLHQAGKEDSAIHSWEGSSGAAWRLSSQGPFISPAEPVLPLPTLQGPRSAPCLRLLVHRSSLRAAAGASLHQGAGVPQRTFEEVCRKRVTSHVPPPPSKHFKCVHLPGFLPPRLLLGFTQPSKATRSPQVPGAPSALWEGRFPGDDNLWNQPWPRSS